MNKRIDELEKYYAPIESCDRKAWFAFLMSATLSILIPFVQIPFLQEGVSVLFVLFVIAHSVLYHYSGFYLTPRAEHLRRKQLLSDSLGIPLTPEKTKLYYNNEVLPSVIRLGANVMENAFFAKHVCNEMAKTERLKISIYSLVWILAIINRSTDLDFILALTQVLFSAEIVIRWIKIEGLRAQNELIYEKLYSLYLSKNTSKATGVEVVSILDAFASYEAAKSAASIKQSSKIFNKLNSRLTTEWENIRDQLQIKPTR